MVKITALFTCFNRIEKTQNCIRSLAEGNSELDIEFVVVDDGSNDGTAEMLEKMKQEYAIHAIHTKGGLFYSGGMHNGMVYINEQKMASDYVLLLNDDVAFFPQAIEKLVVQSKEKENAVIVGITCASNGSYTYGAICYTKGIRYVGIGIEASNTKSDTFNANCVLIPRKIFDAVPIMDGYYVHSLGDFDYGLSISRRRYPIYPSCEYVGICERNSSVNGWVDKRLSRFERMRKKESVKGAPTKQWFYFLKKNFGIVKAVVYTITPYLKIFLKR